MSHNIKLRNLSGGRQRLFHFYRHSLKTSVRALKEDKPVKILRGEIQVLQQHKEEIRNRRAITLQIMVMCCIYVIRISKVSKVKPTP